MKRLFTLLVLSLNILLILAVPVERVRRMVTLVDGKQVMVTSCGDETLSYFLTDDMLVVELTEHGFESTGQSPEQYLQKKSKTRRALPRKVGSRSGALLNQLGVKHVPVILVEFSDKKMTSAADSAGINHYWNLFCNGTMDGKPVSGLRSQSSVRDYFIQQSSGQFLPEFDVIGPIQLDMAYSYYGKDSGDTKDINYGKFANEALTKAVNVYSDWSKYDNDGDGSVDATVFIYAGMGQNYTHNYGDRNTIWPKETASSYTIGNVHFAGCFATCEMHPTAASNNVITSWIPDGTGVFIHEMSHALGLPDLYDLNNVAFGMDFWSIMDYGQYASNSYAPVGYTAYERDFMGWQQLITLTDSCKITIPCFAKGGAGYKIVNPANPNEYYILDNRQSFGADSVFCRSRGHGLLIMHVDYNYNIWNNNRVNSTVDHQRLTIIPANGTLVGSNNYSKNGGSAGWTESLKGNPYPGIKENHELTDESSPASTVFTGGFMRQPLYDITENDDHTVTVSFLKRFGDEDAIRGVAQNHQIVSIYDLTGKYITTCSEDEVNNNSLKSGMYIVKKNNDKAKKLITK